MRQGMSRSGSQTPQAMSSSTFPLILGTARDRDGAVLLFLVHDEKGDATQTKKAATICVKPTSTNNSICIETLSVYRVFSPWRLLGLSLTWTRVFGSLSSTKPCNRYASDKQPVPSAADRITMLAVAQIRRLNALNETALQNVPQNWHESRA